MNADFKAALQRIGLNDASVNAIGSQGYLEIDDFLDLSEGGVDKMAEYIKKLFPIKDPKNPNVATDVMIPFRSLTLLSAMRHWHAQKNRTGESNDATLFDGAVIKLAMARYKEEKEIKEATKGVDPVKPKPLKDLSHFRSFKEGFDSYTQQIRGAACIPINYVYRMDEVETPEALAADNYADEDARLGARTKLSGTHFKIDNRMVFEFLEAHCSTGPGWVFIKQFKRTHDGRQAMLTLKLQSEGNSVTNHRRDIAKALLRTTTYSGTRRNFSFNDYINKFQQAKNELTELGEAPSEASMVTDFMAGILDKELASAKIAVIADAKYRENWMEAQQFFLTIVQSQSVQAKTTREVSAVTTTREAAAAASTPQPGRGKGGGRGGGRGGAGRGKGSEGRGRGGRGAGGDKSQTYTGEIHSGNFPPPIWKTLTSEQKAAVFALRESEKEDGADASKKRNVSVIETSRPSALEDTTIAVTADSIPPPPESPLKQPRMGEALEKDNNRKGVHFTFGRNTYNRQCKDKVVPQVRHTLDEMD